VEFIGTFFFVLVIGLVVGKAAEGVIAPGAGDFAPLVIGCTLMILVFAGGHISGGHFNPAVTLGVFLRGKCPAADVAPYMIAQCVGGVLGALTVNYIKGGPQALAATPDAMVTKAMLVEFLFTYFLVNNVLNSATSKKNAGNSYYGIAIGFTIVVAAYAGGGISGGAYNPAIACGLSALGIKPLASIWMFIVPELLGAVAAAIMYKVINPDEA
jgi:aquaporin Z